MLTYGGYRVLHGETEIGVLAAFLLYLRRFFEPMQELSQFYNSLQSATAALEKLAGVLDERPAVPEPARPVPLPRRRRPARSTFDGVRFGYRDGAPVLPDARPAHPGRADRGAGRRDRRRQDDGGQAGGPVLRPGRRRGPRSTASTCATSPRPTCAARSSW